LFIGKIKSNRAALIKADNIGVEIKRCSNA